MLNTADIHIYRKVLVCFLFGDEFLVILVIYIT